MARHPPHCVCVYVGVGEGCLLPQDWEQGPFWHWPPLWDAMDWMVGAMVILAVASVPSALQEGQIDTKD